MTWRGTQGGSAASIALALFVLCVETDPSRAADPAQLAQVFPPRPTQAPSSPTPPQPAFQQSTPPGTQTQSVPLAAILGDPTRSFIRLVNMQGPTESTYAVGRGLAGRLHIERQVRDVGQGAKTYLHVSGLSNPPSVTPQGNELRLRFLFPSLVFRTFYREYTAEGDTALGDVAAANVTADVYLTPIADQRGLPAIQGVRVVFNGAISPPERCIYLFDLVYAVNVCGLANDYLKDIKLTLENGIREGLMQPQARTEFERAMLEFLRGDLLARSGLNPAGGQLDIVQAVFRGTDYVVSFVARP